MDDCNIVTVNLLCESYLQFSYSLLDIHYSQLVGCCDSSSCGLSARVDDISSCYEDFSCNGIESSSCLIAKEFDGFHQVVVDSCEKEYIGKSDVSTVLCYGSGYGCYIEVLSIRSYAFSKCCECLG